MNLAQIYGHKIRVRVLGILQKEDTFLCVNHAGLNNENEFWHFPGGGLEPHETIAEGLTREFLEETGLTIEVSDFKGIKELIKPPLHAIELIFSVKLISGDLIVGHDPELNIIKDVKFLPKEELHKIPEKLISSSIFDFI